MSQEEPLDLSMPSRARSTERSGSQNDEPKFPTSLETTEHSNDSSANAESHESGESHDETDRLSQYTTMVDSPTEGTIYSPGGSIISSPPHHSQSKDDHVFKRPFDASSPHSAVVTIRLDPSAETSTEGIMASTERASLSSPLRTHSRLHQDDPAEIEQSSVSLSSSVVNTASDAGATFMEKLTRFLHTRKDIPVPRQLASVPSVPLHVSTQPGPGPSVPLHVPKQPDLGPSVPFPVPKQSGASVQTQTNVKNHLTTGERQPDAMITPRSYHLDANIPPRKVNHPFLFPIQPDPSVQTAPAPRDVEETSVLARERQPDEIRTPRPYNLNSNIPPIMVSQTFVFPTQPSPSVQTSPAPRDVRETSRLIGERQADGINVTRPLNLYPSTPPSLASLNMMYPVAALRGMYSSRMMAGASGIGPYAHNSVSPFNSASRASLPTLPLSPQSPVTRRFATPRRRRGRQGNSSTSSETCGSSSTTVRNSSTSSETCGSSSTAARNSSTSSELCGSSSTAVRNISTRSETCGSSSSAVRNSSVNSELCGSSNATVRNSSTRSETCGSNSATVRNSSVNREACGSSSTDEVSNADSDNSANVDTQNTYPRGDSASSLDERNKPSSSGGLKDKAYYARRKKNNEAAKKSRDFRRQKAVETELRLPELEREYVELKLSVDMYQTEIARLRYLHVMQTWRQNEEDIEEDNEEDNNEDNQKDNKDDNDDSGNTT